MLMTPPVPEKVRVLSPAWYRAAVEFQGRPEQEQHLHLETEFIHGGSPWGFSNFSDAWADSGVAHLRCVAGNGGATTSNRTDCGAGRLIWLSGKTRLWAPPPMPNKHVGAREIKILTCSSNAPLKP